MRWGDSGYEDTDCGRRGIVSFLREAGSQVEGIKMSKPATTAQRLCASCENFDIVLLIWMPDDGMQVLESTKPFCPGTEFIILTAVDDIQNHVGDAAGSRDYLVRSPWTMSCCFCPLNYL